jgi:excisionase family DNA binding protein
MSFDPLIQAKANGSAAPAAHASRPPYVDLLTVAEAAAMLRVSHATILTWIAGDGIPYIELPSVGQRKQYRIPLQGLLASLDGKYDLRGALREQNARMRQADVPED